MKEKIKMAVGDPRDTIFIECKECGHIEQVERYCPYTGHRYGRGFEYKCSKCKGTMEEQNDDN